MNKIKGNKLIINHQNANAGDEYETIGIACSDETTDLATGTAKATFVMPFNLRVSEIFASLSTAQTAGSIMTIDINMAGVSIFTQRLTIDNNEKNSLSAAAPWTPVNDPTLLTKGSEITIDIDQVGSTPGKGLKIYLTGVKTYT